MHALCNKIYLGSRFRQDAILAFKQCERQIHLNTDRDFSEYHAIKL